MPRPRSSGLNTVRKRLADGSVKTYHYDRQTGLFLGHDRAAALARVSTVEPAAPTGFPAGSLASLILEYKRSNRFEKLKPNTKKLYRGYLDQMQEQFGDLPFRAIRPPMIEGIKNAHKATPSKANMILALFRILLNYAVKLGYMPTNPAANPGRLPPAKREHIWDKDETERFLGAARTSLRLAFALLLYTLQRPSDVLKMTVGRVTKRNGRLYIALRQQKTDVLLDVPVHAELAPLLQARLDEKKGLLLVPSPRGMAWSRRNFSRAWDHDLALATAKLKEELLGQGLSDAEADAELTRRHRQRRDLRRTGIVRLAEAGATTPMIAALSGHTIDYCQRIIDTYLPRRTEVALAGIEVWERSYESARGVAKTP